MKAITDYECSNELLSRNSGFGIQKFEQLIRKITKTDFKLKKGISHMNAIVSFVQELKNTESNLFYRFDDRFGFENFHSSLKSNKNLNQTLRILLGQTK